MNPGTIGLIGGIGGSALGLIGALIGTYVSIKKSKSKEERALVFKAALLIWTLLICLIVVPMILSFSGFFPRWGYWPPFLVFFILLGPFIREVNRRQMAIRGESEEHSKKRRPVF